MSTGFRLKGSALVVIDQEAAVREGLTITGTDDVVHVHAGPEGRPSSTFSPLFHLLDDEQLLESEYGQVVTAAELRARAGVGDPSPRKWTGPRAHFIGPLRHQLTPRELEVGDEDLIGVLDRLAGRQVWVTIQDLGPVTP